MLCVWIYVLYVLILTLLLAVDLVLMYSWPSILISELIDWNLGLIVSQMLFALLYSVWSERLSQQKGNCVSSSLLHPFISSSLTSQVSFHLSLLPLSIFSHFHDLPSALSSSSQISSLHSFNNTFPMKREIRLNFKGLIFFIFIFFVKNTVI